eukprot:CAMPEP_0195272916 /NCGR_PEP_ID=MMETSP0706-20130129/16118_1 /TAXON_ID=33640 /ORGANISM="Asterionellopsis glacialis, Strain CCMP134" /LENGTH=66 /DNA_ID=CAMNT_0040329245 /DNA_START=83 /DNA_END=280 /DNA_ORIENTATION=-
MGFTTTATSMPSRSFHRGELLFLLLLGYGFRQIIIYSIDHIISILLFMLSALLKFPLGIPEENTDK